MFESNYELHRVIAIEKVNLDEDVEEIEHE
jgi:hypothetical protein